jgi:uncharacterized membrane protein YoaK (UPF0700 family)
MLAFAHLFQRTRANLAQQPDALLTILLLLAASVLVVLAAWPNHRWFKAAVLAYVYLP